MMMLGCLINSLIGIAVFFVAIVAAVWLIIMHSSLPLRFVTKLIEEGGTDSPEEAETETEATDDMVLLFQVNQPVGRLAATPHAYGLMIRTGPKRPDFMSGGSSV